MERKWSWKISRILVTLLVCACAALPAAARVNCDGGDHRYALGSGFYAPDFNAAMAYAHQSCLWYWPNSHSYVAANGYEVVKPAGVNTYYYECWKCRGVPLPLKQYPFALALDNALAARPGVVIGGSTGEIALDESTTLWVYNIDIEQADGIVRVCVDTQTGEIVAAPPSDADAGDQ